MLLVLFAALLHAGWNVMVKSGHDKLLDTIAVSVGAAMFALIAIPFLPLPAPQSYPYLIASVAIHAVYFALVALAYRGGDLSYAYPIMRGSAPLLTAVFGVLLFGEALSITGWTGLLILCAGIFTLTRDSWRSGRFSASQTGFAFANALVIVAYTLADGSGVRLSSNAFSYIVWLFFLNALPLLALGAVRRGRALPSLLAGRGKIIFGGGFCILAAYGVALWAMTLSPIALVAALRETSVIFGTAIAALHLKERFGAARYVAAALVCVGAATLKFA